MFQAEPSITHVPALREQVVAVLESINQPQVSVPGRAVEPVLGQLCGIRNPNGTFSIYIALHFPKSGENVIYVHPRRQLSREEYRAAEVEGVHFLESMGFMLDNLNFTKLSPEMQEQALRRIPLFRPTSPPAAPSPAPGAVPTAADTARLARLLASF